MADKRLPRITPFAVGAIPGVTGGETIAEPWGDQVAEAINTHTHGGMAGSAGEGQIDHATLVGVAEDQHHARLHAASHAAGGADPLPAGSNVIAIEVVASGGGAVVAQGDVADLLIPFDCTITQWTVLADAVGSITFAVARRPYATYPPLGGDNLGNAAVANANKAQGAVSWAIVAGDVLRVYTTAAATTIKRATLALTATRT